MTRFKVTVVRTVTAPITGTGDTRGATMSYGGQYYATGQAGQGNVTAIVRYTLSYN